MTKIFCEYPWNNIYVHPDGNVKTCCIGRYNLGNIKTDNIQDILNGEQLSKIKSDFLEGKWPNNCVACRFGEKVGFETMQSNNPESEEKIRNNPNDFFLEHLDYRWDNTCNLSCIYCRSSLSSKWEKIEGKTPSYVENDHTEDFHSFIFDNVKNLKMIRLYGGEPLLLKKSLKLIDSIQDDTQILISSNLSIPNLEKNKVFNALKDRKKVIWYVSFENIGKKYEYVRNGADWNVFEKNLKLVTSMPNFKVSSASSYHVLSALDLVEFYNYCYAYGNITVRWHGVTDPAQLNVYRAPQHIRDMCVNNIETALNTHHIPNKRLLTNILDGYKNVPTTEDSLQHLDAFLKSTEEKLSKKVSYLQLWPELR
jgi:radical SAM protein with 4Fe4S-binding SPASM domain